MAITRVASTCYSKEDQEHSFYLESLRANANFPKRVKASRNPISRNCRCTVQGCTRFWFKNLSNSAFIPLFGTLTSSVSRHSLRCIVKHIFNYQRVQCGTRKPSSNVSKTPRRIGSKSVSVRYQIGNVFGVSEHGS